MKKYILAAILIFVLTLGAVGYFYKSDDNKVEEYIGNHPIENYVPDEASINSVPYSYKGEGKYFSVTCDVRLLTHSEKQERIALKINEINQLLESAKEHPLRAKHYRLIIDKIKRDIEIFANQDLYVTEVKGRLKDPTVNLKENDVLSFYIEGKDRTYLSSSTFLESQSWATIINSKDGGYSQGILLPNNEGYNIKICCGDIEDNIKLTK